MKFLAGLIIGVLAILIIFCIAIGIAGLMFCEIFCSFLNAIFNKRK